MPNEPTPHVNDNDIIATSLLTALFSAKSNGDILLSHLLMMALEHVFETDEKSQALAKDKQLFQKLGKSRKACALAE